MPAGWTFHEFPAAIGTEPHLAGFTLGRMNNYDLVTYNCYPVAGIWNVATGDLLALDPLPGFAGAGVNDVNDFGVAVGYSQRVDPAHVHMPGSVPITEYRATQWDTDGAPTDISGSLNPSWDGSAVWGTQATRINSSGLVAGNVVTGDWSIVLRHPYVDDLVLYDDSFHNGVVDVQLNNAGHAAGTVIEYPAVTIVRWFWDGSSVTVIDTPADGGVADMKQTDDTVILVDVEDTSVPGTPESTITLSTWTPDDGATVVFGPTAFDEDADIYSRPVLLNAPINRYGDIGYYVYSTNHEWGELIANPSNLPGDASGFSDHVNDINNRGWILFNRGYGFNNLHPGVYVPFASLLPAAVDLAEVRYRAAV